MPKDFPTSIEKFLELPKYNKPVWNDNTNFEEDLDEKVKRDGFDTVLREDLLKTNNNICIFSLSLSLSLIINPFIYVVLFQAYFLLCFFFVVIIINKKTIFSFFFFSQFTAEQNITRELVNCSIKNCGLIVSMNNKKMQTIGIYI